MANPMPDPMAHPMAAANLFAGETTSHVVYFQTSLNDPRNQVTQVGNVTNIEIPNQGPLPIEQMASDFGMPLPGGFTDQVQADIDAAQQASPVEQSPQLVDQMITAIAPVFTEGINEQKEALVDAMLPTLANDPQLRQYIPPVLLNEAPPQGAQSAAPSDDGQASVVDTAASIVPDTSADGGFVSPDGMPT